MKKCFSVFLFICIVLNVYPHSGRTDANGGHHDRKNGGYHYHNGGSRSSVHVPNLDIEIEMYISQDANIRSGSSIKSSKIGTLYKGTKVQIISIQNGWAKVEVSDFSGWVSFSLLSFSR
jgi:uncharacterized protein YgiM (DUF1202 family)